MAAIEQETSTRTDAEALMDEVLALRNAVAGTGDGFAARFGCGDDDASLANLAHYLALRHHDLRPLQRRLMWHGLSSLGRLESRVLPTLDAVLGALGAITACPAPFALPSQAEFFAGEDRLVKAADALFGPPPAHRRSRIMVTLPSEATDPDYVGALARQGMDIARINCAHDDNVAWQKMAANVRGAGAQLGRPLSVMMDIAGPKIRTEAVVAPETRPRLMPGDALGLVASGPLQPEADTPYVASVTLPEMVNRLTAGERFSYNDGKLEGLVESVGEGRATVRVTRTKAGGVKLKAQKGINLPDTVLGLSPLTAKDEADLATILDCADMIGYSFVSRPDDLDLLEEAIGRRGSRRNAPGLVAKIERPEAVTNLPALIARAHKRRPIGIMIARGDLAAEIGFERLAEMQEEILWICEAASVPAIWATQVLEDLVQSGIPSRGEMTDAAMAARAECVMLNKGPAVGHAIALLDRLLARMDAHLFKKTPMLRALRSW